VQVCRDVRPLLRAHALAALVGEGAQQPADPRAEDQPDAEHRDHQRGRQVERGTPAALHGQEVQGRDGDQAGPSGDPRGERPAERLPHPPTPCHVVELAPDDRETDDRHEQGAEQSVVDAAARGLQQQQDADADGSERDGLDDLDGPARPPLRSPRRVADSNPGESSGCCSGSRRHRSRYAMTPRPWNQVATISASRT
jgi:hypothetical protein